MGLMKKLTSAIVASSLVLSLVGTAAAAYTPAAGETAGKRMQDLGIINGKPGIGLDLNGEITRAELVTVIVRAFGKEADAQLLKGSTAFPDIANHWASGNIAMAKALVEKAGSDAIGMPDGTFAPDAKLTAAQAVAFLMKFVGVKADASKTWPANYLDVAVEKNIITAEDKALIAPQLNENATRGLTFYMFDRAFFGYQLPTGKTFYTQYVDTMAPEVTLNAIDATTIDSKVTVTGNVKGATSVFVGTTAVTPDASGNFSATYDLPELKEYPVTVTARDLAGNTTEKSTKVTRIAGTAASIEASDITVAAGGTFEVKAVVKDAAGNVLATPVTGTATAGTYADGKYTAGAAIGTAELTLKAGEIEKKVTVTVVAGALATIVPSKGSVAPGEYATFTAKDAAGNVIASGVTYAQTSADAMIDATTGKFIASKAGSYTVTANQGTTSVTGTVGVYGTVKKLAVNPGEAMVANDATEYEFTVNVTDANGNVIADYDDNVTVTENAGLDFDEEVVAAEAGVATFTVTVPSGFGTGEVDVDFSAEEGDITATGTFATVAQQATSLEITTPSHLAIEDEQAKGTIAVLDQAGEAMADASGSWDVTLTVSGPAKISTYTDDADTRDDVDEKDSITVPATGDGANFWLWSKDATQLGTITTTAAFTGFASVTGTTTAAIGLAPSKIVVKPVSTESKKANQEGVYLFQLQLTDKNGVPRLADGDTAVTLTFDNDDSDELTVAYDATKADIDTAAEALAADAPVVDDEVTVTILNGENNYYVAVTAEAVAGSIPFTATATDFTKATGTVEFKSGDLAGVEFTRDDVRVLNGSGVVTKLTAQLVDGAGNDVKTADVEVQFVPSSKNYVRLNGAANEDITVKTDANGEASFEMVLVPGTATYEVEAYVDVDEDGEFAVDELGDTLAATLVDNITASITANTYVTRDAVTSRTTSFNSSEEIEIRVTAKDNNGLAIEDNDDLAAALTITGPAWEKDVEEDKEGYAFVWDVDLEAYVATLTAQRSGAFSYSVSDSGIAAEVKTPSRSLSVAPGAAYKVVVVEANSDDEIDVTSGKVKALTLRVADMYGNLLTADKVRSAVSFSVSFEDAVDSEEAADYYEVRTGSETGPMLADDVVKTIAAGRNSYTIYVLTNDADTATLTIDTGAAADADGDEDTVYTVNVAE